MNHNQNGGSQLANTIRIKRFFQALQARNKIVPVATVELPDRVKWEQAISAARRIPMTGRNSPRRKLRENRYLLDFEDNDDAVLILMTVGGKLIEPD